jgi:hypothetical protein
MVDGQVRRTLRKPIRFTEPVSGDGNVAESVSGTEQNSDTSTDGNDSHVDGQSFSVKRDGDSGTIGIIEVNPEQLGDYINSRTGSGTGDGDGSGTRRRTRSDAGKPRGTRKRKAIDQNYEAVVSMVHTWASVLLKTPEIELEQSEAKKLADAYNEFCQYHNVPILTPKRMSEINLVAVALTLYGPRYVAWRARMKQQRQEKHGIVTPINHEARAVHVPVM